MNNELTYYVDEKEKTVVCIAEDCEYDFINDMMRKFSTHNIVEKFILYSLIETFESDFVMNYKYVGKAKCSDSDVFDIEKGKKVARIKMRKAYNKAKIKRINKISQVLRNMTEEIFVSSNFYMSNDVKYTICLDKNME